MIVIGMSLFFHDLMELGWMIQGITRSNPDRQSINQSIRVSSGSLSEIFAPCPPFLFWSSRLSYAGLLVRSTEPAMCPFAT
jgi:hypothetical protein